MTATLNIAADRNIATKKSDLQFAYWMIQTIETSVADVMKCQKQLQDVVVHAPKEATKREALAYLEKQDLLVKFANDLLSKSKNLKRNLKIPTTDLRNIFLLVEQLKIEVDLFTHMQFKVKKSYIGFLFEQQMPAALEAIAA